MTALRRLRKMATWALPLAAGVVIGVTGVEWVHAQPQRMTSARLLKTDLSGASDKEVIMTIVDIPPGVAISAHFHYGDEFVYVLDGNYERFVENEQTVVKPGEGYYVAREKTHGGKTLGTTPVKLLTVHVVDKGKPFFGIRAQR